MALFRNFGVNRRNRLCGVHEYASAQFLDFLELAENCSFLKRKLISALNEKWMSTSYKNLNCIDKEKSFCYDALNLGESLAHLFMRFGFNPDSLRPATLPLRSNRRRFAPAEPNK